MSGSYKLIECGVHQELIDDLSAYEDSDAILHSIQLLKVIAAGNCERFCVCGNEDHLSRFRQEDELVRETLVSDGILPAIVSTWESHTDNPTLLGSITSLVSQLFLAESCRSKILNGPIPRLMLEALQKHHNIPAFTQKFVKFFKEQQSVLASQDDTETGCTLLSSALDILIPLAPFVHTDTYVTTLMLCGCLQPLPDDDAVKGYLSDSGVVDAALTVISTRPTDAEIVTEAFGILAGISDSEVDRELMQKTSIDALSTVLRKYTVTNDIVFPVLQIIERLTRKEEYQPALIEILPWVESAGSFVNTADTNTHTLLRSIKARLHVGTRRILTDTTDAHPLTSGTLEEIVKAQIELKFGQRLGNISHAYGSVCLPPDSVMVLYMPDQGETPRVDFCDALRSLSLRVIDLQSCQSVSALKREMVGDGFIVVCSYSTINAKPKSKMQKLHAGLWRELARKRCKGTGAFMVLDERQVQKDESAARVLYTKLCSMVNTMFVKLVPQGAQQDLYKYDTVLCVPFDRYFGEVWASPLCGVDYQR
ncbi:hypothetical protein KIPB_005183 [Kipferlia bialata]|uniref:Uncharacterized protein n=1 Tax=Kipferlia bialata TaxID=797122 RepID=A0A9K3CY60_9EUKA|nr:hypothetical protein KIPB_005183 [Kipferlia bialata]|eukprot:g5183.t1